MKKPIIALALLLLASTALPCFAQNIYDAKRDGSLYNRAPPDEVMRLPKYCWGHYNPRFKGPRFNINKDICGPFTNHFCQGILHFNRSQNPMASKSERKQYLSGSVGHFEYTMKGLKNYPRCNIRKHVTLMLKRARTAASMQMP